MTLTVLCDAWRPEPLAWIHRAEARSIARELRRAGQVVELVAFDEGRLAELRERQLILRLSDPVMFVAAEALTRSGIPYVGPGYEVMARCFDKYEASHIAARHGVTTPETVLGTEAARITLPALLKPRWGSDSLGMRVVRRGRISRSKQTEEFIVQRYVRGVDLTVGVLDGRAGTALQICLPEGVPYSFTRKYLRRPRRVAVTDAKLGERVRAEALRLVRAFGVDWAARVDFIYEAATDRLYFLECDVAPLVGEGSAFELSLTTAGIGRPEQVNLLFEESAVRSKHVNIRAE